MNAVLKPEEFQYTAADAFRAAGVRNTSPFKNIVLPFHLWKHQERALTKALTMARFGLYDRPRLGKTMVMFLTAIYCAQYGVKTILLTPSILFKQIKDEWEKLENNPFTLNTFTQGPAGRDKLLKLWRKDRSLSPDVLLMTREIFVKEREGLYHVGYADLMFDECHQGYVIYHPYSTTREI
jgi:hypothetical protein